MIWLCHTDKFNNTKYCTFDFSVGCDGASVPPEDCDIVKVFQKPFYHVGQSIVFYPLEGHFIMFFSIFFPLKHGGTSSPLNPLVFNIELDKKCSAKTSDLMSTTSASIVAIK